MSVPSIGKFSYFHGHNIVLKEAAEILCLFGSYKEKQQRGQIIEISRSFQKFGLSFVVTQILTSMLWISADMWLL
ncbi:transmembrane protein, putative [Medicago truncatula]|uniref:Transmembrane protein, putative n=1 Tax=Medicago truncatula TaxID=3880 RepID=G7IK69_MEDTR|nr:transmembrane protein, putative [Medicago truncatula]